MKSTRICKKKNKFQSVNVEIAVMTAIVFVVLFVFVIAVYWISGLFQNHAKPPENSQGSIPIKQVSNSFTGKSIDIYFDTHDEAENFGVKFVEVFVKH